MDVAVSISVVDAEDSDAVDVSLVASSPDAHPADNTTATATTNAGIAIDRVLDRPRRTITPVCPTPPQR